MTRSLAAQVWDQDEHTERDLAFLAATEAATQKYLATLRDAKITWLQGELVDVAAWEAAKHLAAWRRDRDYATAEAAYLRDECEFAEAAE